MLPIIIGAVSLIAYGLFDENSKPKVVKKMAKGGSVEGFSIGDKVKYRNAKYHATIIEIVNDENLPYAKIKDSDNKIEKAYLSDLVKVKLTGGNEYVNPKFLNKMAKGGTTDSSDKKYSALKSGTRKSSKYAHVEMRGGRVYHRRNANQYGKAKGGKTYVENRENRSDKRVYLEKGGEVDTWENILVDYGFKKSRTKLGVRFYKKRNYLASVDNRRRMVELYFDDVELYSGYSIQGLIDELDKEFKH
jgi:hypothetical protein